VNNIGDEGTFVIAIADLLTMTQILISLDVSTNSIRNEGCAAIFDTLRVNLSLIDINLGNSTGANDNLIGKIAIPYLYLCRVFCQNTVLSEVNLSTPETVSQFFGGLSVNRTLEKLDLSNNNLRSRGAVKLIQAITHSGIVELSLANTKIEDDVGPEFCIFYKRTNHLFDWICQRIS